MSILYVDLTEGAFSLLPSEPESGLALAIKLYKRYEGKAMVLASPTKESVRYPGATNFIIAFKSPLSDRLEFQYSNQPPGYSLFKMGYEALVIIGKATRLSYISIYPGANAIYQCEQMRGASSSSFEQIAGKNINDTFLSTGRASDNGVKFASVVCGGKAIPGAGLGYVFASMNIKGIAFQGFFRKEDLANDKAAMHFVHKIESSKFSRRIRKNGANCFIDDANRLGWLPVMNYSKRFDPRAYSLDGISFTEAFGNFPDSCQECFLACGRRKKDNSILPSWQECMALGTNLGFFDPRTVSSFVDASYEEGLDPVHLGAILAYVSSLNDSNLEVLSLSGKTKEEYIRLIHSIGESRGVGAIFREGLKGFPDAIQNSYGGAILTDLRGSYSAAILTSLGFDIVLPAGLILPKKELNAKCAATLTFYELCYTLALLSYGYGPIVTACIFWDKLPSFVFSSPLLLRFSSHCFSVYGLKGKDLLRKGIEILDELDLSFCDIPEHFKMDVESNKNTSTVPLLSLQSLFDYEKSKASIYLKSKRDIIRAPKGKIKAAVAPDEDLGLDGDPGLTK